MYMNLLVNLFYSQPVNVQHQVEHFQHFEILMLHSTFYQNNLPYSALNTICKVIIYIAMWIKTICYGVQLVPYVCVLIPGFKSRV